MPGKGSTVCFNVFCQSYWHLLVSILPVVSPHCWFVLVSKGVFLTYSSAFVQEEYFHQLILGWENPEITDRWRGQEGIDAADDLAGYLTALGQREYSPQDVDDFFRLETLEEQTAYRDRPENVRRFVQDLYCKIF